MPPGLFSGGFQHDQRGDGSVRLDWVRQFPAQRPPIWPKDFVLLIETLHQNGLCSTGGSGVSASVRRGSCRYRRRIGSRDSDTLKLSGSDHDGSAGSKHREESAGQVGRLPVGPASLGNQPCRHCARGAGVDPGYFSAVGIKMPTGTSRGLEASAEVHRAGGDTHHLSVPGRCTDGEGSDVLHLTAHGHWQRMPEG